MVGIWNEDCWNVSDISMILLCTRIWIRSVALQYYLCCGLHSVKINEKSTHTHTQCIVETEVKYDVYYAYITAYIQHLCWMKIPSNRNGRWWNCTNKRTNQQTNERERRKRWRKKNTNRPAFRLINDWTHIFLSLCGLAVCRSWCYRCHRSHHCRPRTMFKHFLIHFFLANSCFLYFLCQRVQIVIVCLVLLCRVFFLARTHTHARTIYLYTFIITRLFERSNLNT